MKKILGQEFFRRRPDLVAMDLLGKVILNKRRRVAGMILKWSPILVQRIRHLGLGREEIWLKQCRESPALLVYGVHKQWLLNIVAHEDEKLGAVLIRGIIPMDPMTFRPLGKPIWGPGRVTKYLDVDKRYHKAFLCSCDQELQLRDGLRIDPSCIIRSRRVGVREDLPEPFNFRISCIEELLKRLTS